MQLKSSLRLAGVALAAALLAGGAHSATINKDNTIINVIPSLTGFATTGAMMTGLSVTANFLNGFSQTLFWATTGPSAGGVTGTGWGLNLSGDTFTAPWVFTITGTNGLQLSSLVLDGTNAFTVFDSTDPNSGTPGSAQGANFSVLGDIALDAAATATYSKLVAIGANAPVGDLYQMLTIDFGQAGPRSTFSFGQDTDNDGRLNVPEPGALALAGLALALSGLVGRRATRRS